MIYSKNNIKKLILLLDNVYRLYTFLVQDRFQTNKNMLIFYQNHQIPKLTWIWIINKIVKWIDNRYVNYISGSTPFGLSKFCISCLAWKNIHINIYIKSSFNQYKTTCPLEVFKVIFRFSKVPYDTEICYDNVCM